MRYRISARPETTPDAQPRAPEYTPVSEETSIIFAADTPLRPLPYNGLVPQLAKYDDLPLLTRKRAALWRWRRRRLYVMTHALLAALLKGGGAA
jgi:hypothetical protein